MEVNFSSELQAKIDLVASDSEASTDEYVQQLVEHYVDHDSWLRQRVRQGLNQLDQGEFLSHEEMGTRLKAKLQG